MNLDAYMVGICFRHFQTIISTVLFIDGCLTICLTERKEVIFGNTLNILRCRGFYIRDQRKRWYFYASLPDDWIRRRYWINKITRKIIKDHFLLLLEILYQIILHEYVNIDFLFSEVIPMTSTLDWFLEEIS